MMEERVGRVGRPVTTIFLVLIVLAVGSWMVQMFWDNAVDPIADISKDIRIGEIEVDWGRALDFLNSIFIFVFVAYIAAIIWNWWTLKRERRFRDRFLVILEEQYPELKQSWRVTAAKVNDTLLRAIANTAYMPEETKKLILAEIDGMQLEPDNENSPMKEDE